MEESDIIKKINDSNLWVTAQHKYAEQLLKTYDNVKNRNFIWKKFLETKDFFYNGLFKMGKK